MRKKRQILYSNYVIIAIMEPRLNDKDSNVLDLLQRNYRMTAREIAQTIESLSLPFS
jgi:uncharacterized protein YfbU (UPF0304 family)